MGNVLEFKVTKVIDMIDMASILESWFDDYFTDNAGFTAEEIECIDREAVKKALAKVWLEM